MTVQPPEGSSPPEPVTEETDTHEVVRLRAEVVALQAKSAAVPTSTSRRKFSPRAISSVALFVIAGLLLPFGLTAYWGQRTLLDTSQYISTVAPLSQDPTVQLAVGDVISKQLQANFDLKAQVAGLLPAKAQPLAGPIASGVQSFIDAQIHKFLASDQFSALWTNINLATQQQLVKALQGNQTGSITIQGDQVVLDTGTLLTQIKAQLVAQGLTIVDKIPIPPVADQQIVLLSSPQLQQIQTAYKLGQPVAKWAIWLVALMFLGAVLLARRRARAVLVTGLIAIAGALLVRLGMGVGATQLSSVLSGTPFALASDAFFNQLTLYLLVAVRTLFALGVVLAFAGWAFGGTSSAVAAKAWTARNLSGAGAKTGVLGGVGRWVAPKRNWLRVLVIVVAVLIVMVQDRMTAGLLLVVLVGVLVALAIIEFLAGGANTVAPDAPAFDGEPLPSADTLDGELVSAGHDSRDPTATQSPSDQSDQHSKLIRNV